MDASTPARPVRSLEEQGDGPLRRVLWPCSRESHGIDIQLRLFVLV